MPGARSPETAMPELAIDTTVPLNDGHAMPLFGYGTYQVSNGGPCYRAVRHALDIGYRHIDTAALYANEDDVGRAVRDSGIPRGQIFVTTKLWNSDQGYRSALKAFDASLKRLGLDYVDLYLIHWPEPGKRGDSWRALTEIKQQGRARSIGVSNYTVAHLRELLAQSDVVPANNQVEFSPFLYQRALLEFCRAQGITLTAYCPLTHGDKLDHPTLTALGSRHGKTAAQVLLRWALQHGVCAIPKSARLARIDENAALFDFALDAQEMASLDALDENYRTSWDPSRVR
jgi:diketogulonate reductase-like aldo/keto reductase